MTPQQPSLFAVRPSDPDTSHTAARIPRLTLKERVRRVLEKHPAGLTDWEITAELGFPEFRKPTVGKRREELEASDTGLRRMSPTGSPCVVWTLGENQ